VQARNEHHGPAYDQGVVLKKSEIDTTSGLSNGRNVASDPLRVHAMFPMVMTARIGRNFRRPVWLRSSRPDRGRADMCRRPRSPPAKL
jgi:hypothetical protein